MKRTNTCKALLGSISNITLHRFDKSNYIPTVKPEA